jgi:hypothetical protein
MKQEPTKEGERGDNNGGGGRESILGKRTLHVSIPEINEEDGRGNIQSNKTHLTPIPTIQTSSNAPVINKPKPIPTITTSTLVHPSPLPPAPLALIPQQILIQQQILSEQLMQKIQEENLNNSSSSNLPLSTVPTKRPRGRPPLSSKNKGLLRTSPLWPLVLNYPSVFRCTVSTRSSSDPSASSTFQSESWCCA